MSMLGRFLYVMGCQIKYLRSMKGLRNLTRTRKPIKLKVLLLKFGVHRQLKWILSGTLLSGFHFLFLVLYFNLTCFFFLILHSGTQFLLKWSIFCFYVSLFFRKRRRIALHYIKKKKKGGETPVTTHTTPLQNKSTNAPVETKRRPRLDVLQTTGLQGEGEAGKPRKIAPEPPP